MALKPGTEEFWTAQDDARILMASAAIKSDTKRLQNAHQMILDMQSQTQATLDMIFGDGTEKLGQVNNVLQVGLKVE